MSKHTPGPWRIVRGNGNPLIETDGLTVAEVLDDCHPDMDQLEVNARLIAAVPDLRAALIELYDATTDGRPEVIRAARAVARRAMDKADKGTQEGNP